MKIQNEPKINYEVETMDLLTKGGHHNEKQPK